MSKSREKNSGEKNNTCPVCRHPAASPWSGTVGNRYVWRCNDCPGRKCQ